MIPATSFRLQYAIKKRIPPTEKTMQAILDLQRKVNDRLGLTHERLALAPVANTARAFTFPLVRFAPDRTLNLNPILPDDSPDRIGDASALGSTRAPNIWVAHLVAGFLRHVSRAFPDLVFELRDEGGRFVIPGAVFIRGGRVELQSEWLNRERARALEATGDPQAAAPFVYAEAQALSGTFFESVPASAFAEAPGVEQFVSQTDDLDAMTLEDLADTVVERIAAERIPAHA